MLETPPLRTLYEPAPVIRTRWLAVPGGHELHVQESGVPDGRPVVVLHGGPGSGCSPFLRRFFDPRRYRIVCIDQRGAGLSRPRGEVAHNTTVDLLADLQAVRSALGIERWAVVGGSWGATLALAHALDAPEAVAALLLRGVFLARAPDIEAFFDGARHGQPQAWTAYSRTAAAQGEPLIDSLFRTLAGPDGDAARAVALHWWAWEQTLAGAGVTAAPDAAAVDALVARYRVQSHYLRHGCWLAEAPLLERCAALPRVPTLLLHGRHDAICEPLGAAALHAVAPHSRLQWVEAAGHDPTHPAMIDATVRALDRYAAMGDFDPEAAA